MRKVNGFGGGRAFGPYVVQAIEDRLERLRPLFVLKHKDGRYGPVQMDVHFGRRFYTDHDAIVRLQTAYDGSASILDRLTRACWDALRDCASSDHWYTYEKDWGCEDRGEYEPDEG